jgi:uncharacterized membrane protein
MQGDNHMRNKSRSRARIDAKVTIQATPEQVFSYLKDLKYHSLWNPHLQKISPITKLQPGVAYKTSSLILGIPVSGTNTVLRLKPNEVLEIQNVAGTLEYKVTFRLKQSGKGTTVRCTTNLYAKHSSFVFAAPLLKALAQRELRTDLDALKEAVEQKKK